MNNPTKKISKNDRVETRNDKKKKLAHDESAKQIQLLAELFPQPLREKPASINA